MPVSAHHYCQQLPYETETVNSDGEAGLNIRENRSGYMPWLLASAHQTKERISLRAKK